jgi:hypothetical protein
MKGDRLIDRIGEYEDKALACGDLQSAIRLNWLRNAVRFDGLSYDEGCYQLLALTIGGKFDTSLAS